MSYHIEKVTGGDAFGRDFPAGLRVLSISDDPTLEYMLRSCHYEVTICNRANDEFSHLRKINSKFDIVMIDIDMPGINDGIRLVEKIATHINSPVIAMSKKYNKNLVMKAMIKGAIGYLVKPLKLEEVKVVWQHVVRHQKNNFNLSEETTIDNLKHIVKIESDKNINDDEDNKEEYQNDEEVDDGGEIVSSSSFKKPRMAWSVELHEQFVDVVNQMGLRNAVPKKILELMNVPSLTRENVASHLQKYRLYVRRKEDHVDSKFKLQSGVDKCNINAASFVNEFPRDPTQQILSIGREMVVGVEGMDCGRAIVNNHQQIQNERSYFPDCGSAEEQVLAMEDYRFCKSDNQHPTTMLQLRGVEDLVVMQGFPNSSHSEMFLEDSSQEATLLPNNNDYLKKYYPFTLHDVHLPVWDQIQSHDN